jgi:outer membrane murein-binding lipoprotein Lpp
MRKLVLSLAVISAIVFASCSNQSNTTETTSDSTITEVVDSFEMSLDSMEIVPMENPSDSITTDLDQ